MRAVADAEHGGVLAEAIRALLAEAVAARAGGAAVHGGGEPAERPNAPKAKPERKPAPPEVKAGEDLAEWAAREIAAGADVKKMSLRRGRR